MLAPLALLLVPEARCDHLVFMHALKVQLIVILCCGVVYDCSHTADMHDVVMSRVTVAFIRHSSFKNQSNLSGKVMRKPSLLSWMSVKPLTLSGIKVFLSNFIKKASTTEFGISSSTGMPPPPAVFS